MPMSQLATPAGIDHDYNFLSKIERDVERKDRELVEERGVVTVRELREGPPDPRFELKQGARGGRGGMRGGMGRHHEPRSENDQKVYKAQQRIGVRVEKLPKGMARQKLNGTSWSKKQKCVVWQVEWMVPRDEAKDEPKLMEVAQGKEDGQNEGQKEGKVQLESSLSKMLTTTPIGLAYTSLLEERRRAAMTPEAKAQEKKRRAVEISEKAARRAKENAAKAQVPSSEAVAPSSKDRGEFIAKAVARDEVEVDSTGEKKRKAEEDLQEDEAKKIKVEASSETTHPPPQAETQQPISEDKAESQLSTKPLDPHLATTITPSSPPYVYDGPYTFFIRRPHTPSNMPTVLIPLDASKPLEDELYQKTIVEFPTIYVFKRKIPEGFMTQQGFFKSKGLNRMGLVGDDTPSEEDSDEEDVKKEPVEVSDTSSSGSSDESSEDEESDADEESVKVKEEAFKVERQVATPPLETKAAEDAKAGKDVPPVAPVEDVLTATLLS